MYSRATTSAMAERVAAAFLGSGLVSDLDFGGILVRQKI